MSSWDRENERLFRKNWREYRFWYLTHRADGYIWINLRDRRTGRWYRTGRARWTAMRRLAKASHGEIASYNLEFGSSVNPHRLRGFLDYNWQPHHIDFDRQNNSYTNIMLIWGRNIHRIFHNILAEFEENMPGFDKTDLQAQIDILNYMKKTLKMNVIWMLLPPKLKKVKHTLVKILGRVLRSFIRFESTVYGRDSPLKRSSLANRAPPLGASET